MKKLREALGLSQSQMANLIGATTSLAAMYERGERQLSFKQLYMLSMIELLVNEPSDLLAIEKIHLQEQQTVVAIIKQLTIDLKQAEVKYQLLSEKLLQMKDRYEKNHQLWRIISNLRKKMVTGKVEIPYLDLLEIVCHDKLKSCGLHQQIKLEHQIDMLGCKITSAQLLINKYKGFGLPIPQDV